MAKYTPDEKGHFKFEVKINGGSSAIVEISVAENLITTFYKSSVSDEMYKVMQRNEIDARNLPESLKLELESIFSPLSSISGRVVNLIKYCFGQTDIDEKLFRLNSKYWSDDSAIWKTLPLIIQTSQDSRLIKMLDEKSAITIQNYIDNDFTPFLALRHLHKAINENNPRYKWIDATIAAELAIKEFLIRWTPEIETLVIEMPSPSLDKMYGSVLKSFANETSPNLTQLKKGMETRNKLLHRPKEIEVTWEEACSYVHEVECAIYHLLKLLYPNDNSIASHYQQNLPLLRREKK